MTPTVTLGDGWIEVETAGPCRTETTRSPLGRTASVDLFGQPMNLLAKAGGGRSVAEGTIELDGGSAAFCRAREIDGRDTMILSRKLVPATGAAVSVRRMFRRTHRPEAAAARRRGGHRRPGERTERG